MSLGLCFWILMMLYLLFSTWWNWPNQYVVGGNLLIFILLALLGWHSFGPPLHS